MMNESERNTSGGHRADGGMNFEDWMMSKYFTFLLLTALVCSCSSNYELIRPSGRTKSVLSGVVYEQLALKIPHFK